jgi:hypothetical protein
MSRPAHVALQIVEHDPHHAEALHLLGVPALRTTPRQNTIC